MTLYHTKGFGRIEKTGFTGGRLLAVKQAVKVNTPGRGPDPLAAAHGVTRACTKKAPARCGQGMKRAGERFPGLVEFICFVLWASSAFFIWFDPYGPAVFIVPVMAADRKHSGRAAMMPARMDPRAAAAML